MSKKLKAVLSFALALVLVMSLGVSAFADSSNAETEKEKEPEIVQIAFNLGTMEPCAVRMRELGYDDIRIDGVSYRADAKDGVIAINLGDLAAIKLLRENTEKAKELGIDYANLYIRGGKVLVKDDTGLTSDQIAALQQAVASLMSSVRVGVNIGDIFDLANGEKVKLRVQVSNFIYPPQKQTQQIKIQPVEGKDIFTSNSKNFNTEKATTDKDLEKSKNFGGDGSVPISAKTPTVTTLYFYYQGTDSYTDGKLVGSSTDGRVGIAKAENDNNTYYIQVNYEEDSKEEYKEEYKEVTDLTKTKSFGEFWDALISIIKNGKLAQNIKIATDKDGKNVVRDIDIKNTTPKSIDDIKAKDSGYKETELKDTDGNTMKGATGYFPAESEKVTKDDGKNAEVDVNNFVIDFCKHEYKITEKKEATCINPGEVKGVCVICEHEETKTIPIDPTNHKDENNDGKCDRCGATMGVEVNPDITSTDVPSTTTLETPSTYMMNPIVTKQVEDEVEQENEQKDENLDPADTAGKTEEIKEEGKTEETPKASEIPTKLEVSETPKTPVEPAPVTEQNPAHVEPAHETETEE